MKIHIKAHGDPVPFIEFIAKQTTLYVLYENEVYYVRPPMCIGQNGMDTRKIRRDTLVQPIIFGEVEQ